MAGPSGSEFAGTSRFRVEARMGAGGFGVVYRVFDRERSTHVALKTLRHVAPAALYRFKREFRALADVSHPNLVTLYELTSHEDEWFFTMELVEGVSFLQYVRNDGNPGNPDGPGTSTFPSDAESRAFLQQTPSEAGLARSGPPVALSEVRLRQALPQLTAGVLALHASSKLHRDIKPSNVLVTTEGRVVVLDFGLVKELALDETHTHEAIGTPAYMSPEQAAGQPLTEASDWYNVGSMLYEALTGQLPFAGRVLDVLKQKQEMDPVPPGAVAPDTPWDLGALCGELLCRDPRKRPTGADILRKLEGAPAVSPEPPPVAPVSSVPFVGRRWELEALQDAFRIARQGRAVTVAVHGGSGIGKSALVRRFLEQLKRGGEDLVVLSGRCYERESVPYKALDALVDALSQYLRRLPSSQAEGLLPHDVLALARLFPVLRQVGAVSRARRAVLEIPDSQELRRRAFGALRELFVRLSDRKPLVLFIDDIQWGDIDSAALLEALLRPPDPPALMLIGCYRSEEASTSPLLKTVLPMRVKVDPLVERRDIVVGELSPSEAQELALALLGVGHSASQARADAIARESAGNPYLLEELARFAQTGDADETAGSEAREERNAMAEVTLDRVIQARMAQLPAQARRLLDIVAVSSVPIEMEVAYRAADLEQEGDSVLPMVRVAHLVRIRNMAGRSEVETYHDRIRDAVVAQLSPVALRDCHRRLASALLACGRADPERLARHYFGAGDSENAAEYAVSAAARASEALAFERAAELYHLALDLPTDARQEAGELRVRLGDALANAGRGAEAARVYLAAAGEVGPSMAIDLQRRAAQHFLISGHVEDGVRVLNAVLAVFDMTLPKTPRGALISLAARRAWLRLRGLRFREKDETHVSSKDLLRIDTCWSVAVGLSQIDMLRGAHFQARHLSLALRAGEPYRVARALALETAYLAMGGSRTQRRTQSLWRAARGLAERVGHPHTLALATLTEGTSAWTEGRWSEALDACARAEALLRERCTGVVWEILSAQMFQLAALFFLGRVKELSLRLATQLKEAEERGDLLRATVLRIGYCSHVVWLAADDPATARQELDAGLAGWRPGKFDYLHMWALGARTDIDLYAGEPIVVGGMVSGRWRAFARTLDRFVQLGFIRGLDIRARRRLAAAADATSPSERDTLLRGVEDHARRMVGERAPWADPLASLLRAGAAVTRGEADRALALLDTAESGLTLAGMVLHAAAARRRRGELRGGDEGRELVAAADAWMASEGIVNPGRMARMLAPGGWGAAR